MLSERSYLRDNDPHERASVLTWLLCTLGAGFVLQLVYGSGWFGVRSAAIDQELMLTPSGLRSGWLWTLVTHSFLHNVHYIFHLLGVMLMLYFLGRELLPVLGSRRFLGLYFSAILVGALTWTAVHWRIGGMHCGAMAAVDALLVVFACFYPDQEMSFLLFFIFPVTVKPKHLALAFLGVDLFGLLLYEIPGSALPFDFNPANSAHLGGMGVGWLYYRFIHGARWSRGVDMELPRWMKRSAKSSGSPATTRVNIGNREDLRAEVDRILDKINSQGFGALTPEEKRVLDEAKDLLSRR